MSFRIAHAAIDIAAFRESLRDPTCGALALFEGWVRNHNDGSAVDRLAYEVYEPLAIKEGLRILEEARERWGIAQAACIHRAGMLELTDSAVVVGVASAHRDEAFQAARYIIDEVKTRLPIWKKEFYSDGRVEWVNCQRCASHAHAHVHAAPSDSPAAA